MNIRIVKADEKWWYQNHVGEEFEVVQIDGKPNKSEFYFLVKKGNDNFHVKINDAELVGKSYIKIK